MKAEYSERFPAAADQTPPAAAYRDCRLCPRACGRDRTKGEKGVCGVSDVMFIARAALHFWEEPCISGSHGSGAVFFSGCTLRCVFCQNYTLSHGEYGKPVTPERLTEIFFELEEQGANNINLVTPDHYIPSAALAMEKARQEGFRLPFVINCSGYETTAQLRRLDGLADIYLTDLKYIDPEKAEKYSGARDYPERAFEALREMVRQVPQAAFQPEKNGGTEPAEIMQRGVIVRHLLMPGMVRDAKRIVDYVHETYGDAVYLSLMHQFTPFGLEKYPEINRKTTRREYERLVDHTLALGVRNAYIQEGGTAKESFVPVWDGTGV